MNGWKLKFGALFLVTVGVLTGMEQMRIPTSVCRFVKSYQAVRNTNAPLGVWEKIVYSYALTRQHALECKAL
jgi:hypothetical protein